MDIILKLLRNKKKSKKVFLKAQGDSSSVAIGNGGGCNTLLHVLKLYLIIQFK